MKTNRALAGLALCALAGAFAGGVALADEFSPQAVFARSEASNVDDRCADARDFAKLAAKGTAGIDSDAAEDGERAFVLCLHMKRLNPDIDDLRYLVLAAGSAAYIAATKSKGDESLTEFRHADDYAAALGAKSPDREWVEVTKRVGFQDDRASAQANQGQGPVHYQTVLQRDVFGGSHALKYSDVAASLEDAITKALNGSLTTVPPAPPAKPQ